MELIPLGLTGRDVSPIGLGLAALGRPGYINLGHGGDVSDATVAGMEARTHQMLDHAYGVGIRYFDAARSYGHAEAFLASWLSRSPNWQGTIGSKWGYTYTADWETTAAVHEVKNHGVAAFERQVAESVAILGSHLNVYQIHSATLESGVLDNAEVHRGLAELRTQGVEIGFSTSGPQQAAAIRRASEIAVDGVPLFATVQSTWNVLETSAAAALQEAADAGLAVIVKEAVANGRLTSRNPNLPAALAAHARPDAVAMAAALAQPWATVVLSGAATIAQLDSNLDALAVSSDDVAALPDLAEPPSEYWTTRAGLAWT